MWRENVILCVDVCFAEGGGGVVKEYVRSRKKRQWVGEQWKLHPFNVAYVFFTSIFIYSNIKSILSFCIYGYISRYIFPGAWDEVFGRRSPQYRMCRKIIFALRGYLRFIWVATSYAKAFLYWYKRLDVGFKYVNMYFVYFSVLREIFEQFCWCNVESLKNYDLITHIKNDNISRGDFVVHIMKKNGLPVNGSPNIYKRSSKNYKWSPKI